MGARQITELSRFVGARLRATLVVELNPLRAGQLCATVDSVLVHLEAPILFIVQLVHTATKRICL